MKAVLRNHIKTANLQKKHYLKDCHLVIDGHGFFKDSYRDSGCQYIVGPECDKYAEYLVKKLSVFQKCNIKCYVVFKGTTKREDKSRKLERHQIVLDDRKTLLNHQSYFDPLFLKDVQQEVLDKMSIKYFCCEYDSIEAVIGVAREFKCPVVTSNVDYCLFGVSCILPKDIFYHNSSETLECIMYEHDKYKSFFGIYNKMPTLLTLLNDSIDYSEAIPDWSESKKNSDLLPLIRWTKRQRENVILNVSKMIADENQRSVLLEFYKKMQILYFYPTCNLAVNYFKRSKSYGLFKDDKKWFSKGISTGRIAIPFIDIKRKGYITGSIQMYDENRSDAMEAAGRIIAFSHCVLTNSKTSSLDFIGRKNNISSIWKIDTSFESPILNGSIFTKRSKRIKNDVKNPFHLFVNDVIPDEELQDTLQYVPSDCKILFLALLYYVLKINKKFIDGAYFVFLSYFMIRHVKKNIRNTANTLSVCENIFFPSVDIKEYKNMYNGFKCLFDEIDLKHKYNINIIHTLAEFQHCLEQINYLNKLCGSIFVPTCYSETYNANFIYNAFLLFKNKDNLEKHFNSKYKGFNTYIDLADRFETIVSRKGNNL